jgi:hypothetical protein
MGPVRARLVPVVLAAVVLVPLGLAGCSTEVVGQASPARTVAPTGTPTPTSSAPTTPPTTAAPTTAPAPTTVTAPPQQLAAGALADGAPVTVSGTGSTLVTYTRGDFAVVGTLDCSACAGPVQLTATGRSAPLAGGTAPWSGQGLTDVTDDGTPEGDVVVQAEGSWTLTLSSWNDLEPVYGPQTVTGSAVLRLADAAPTLGFSWTPAGPGDEVTARMFSSAEAGGGTQVFGNTEAYSTSVDAAAPGVLAVRTNGTWTVTPGG